MSARPVYFKALLLVFVFSLNTVVGAACAFSKLFHQLHHHGSSRNENHQHADGVVHQHEHDATHHQEASGEECCSRSSVEFNQLDKMMAHTVLLQLSAVPEFDPCSPYNNLFPSSRQPANSFSDNLRWRPPATIQDLRIVIQSFQI